MFEDSISKLQRDFYTTLLSTQLFFLILTTLEKKCHLSLNKNIYGRAIIENVLRIRCSRIEVKWQFNMKFFNTAFQYRCRIFFSCCWILGNKINRIVIVSHLTRAVWKCSKQRFNSFLLYRHENISRFRLKQRLLIILVK